MIGIALLIGAAIIGAGAVARFWDNIRDWIIRGAEKVQKIIEGIVHGFKIFAKKIGEAYQEISRHYSKDPYGNWEETTVTRQVSANDVPADILAAASNHETEITEKLQLELA